MALNNKVNELNYDIFVDVDSDCVMIELLQLQLQLQRSSYHFLNFNIVMSIFIPNDDEINCRWANEGGSLKN